MGSEKSLSFWLEKCGQEFLSMAWVFSAISFLVTVKKKACLKSQGWLRDPLPSVWWWCWGRRQACPRGKRRKRSWDRGGGKRTKWCPWRQCGPRLSTAWQSQRLKAKKGHFAHCSNPEVRIRKKMQPEFEAAVRTPMKRASKWAPTWYSWPLASRSLWSYDPKLGP